MKHFILLLYLVTSTAFADWSKIPASDFELGPPPKEGSKGFKNDFEILLDYQDSRTQAQCERAQYQRWPNFRVLFQGKDSVLTQSESAHVQTFMRRVLKFSEKVSAYIKKQYQRARPYETDERLEPCVDKPGGSTSYPSSHAVIGAAGACVLTEIFPAKADAILEYGKELGELRAIVGVHYPSDVMAGQKLGDAICRRLLSEKDFHDEVERLAQ
jgi:acid phosphatase (class A)